LIIKTGFQTIIDWKISDGFAPIVIHKQRRFAGKIISKWATGETGYHKTLLRSSFRFESEVAYHFMKEKDECHTLQELYERGYIVHVFAGKDGKLLTPKQGEKLEDLILRAANESQDGDVWITPHWC
jgi:hypothetical protein